MGEKSERENMCLNRGSSSNGDSECACRGTGHCVCLSVDQGREVEPGKLLAITLRKRQDGQEDRLHRQLLIVNTGKNIEREIKRSIKQAFGHQRSQRTVETRSSFP